jgi:hypothetical protein
VLNAVYISTPQPYASASLQEETWDLGLHSPAKPEECLEAVVVLALVVFLSNRPFYELLLGSYRVPEAQTGGHLGPPLRQLPKAERCAEDEGAEHAGFSLRKSPHAMATRALSVLLLVLWHAACETVCVLFKVERHLERVVVAGTKQGVLAFACRMVIGDQLSLSHKMIRTHTLKRRHELVQQLRASQPGPLGGERALYPPFRAAQVWL